MTMTHDIANQQPFQPHTCPCGCGHIVSREQTFYASNYDREDLAATIDERIAEAVAKAELEARRHGAKWERIVAEIQAEMAKQVAEWAARIEVTCRCCEAEFSPDAYREHIAEAPVWCNRAQWGSEIAIDDAQDSDPAVETG